MEKLEKVESLSTDSGMGLVDSDLESSCASDAFSPPTPAEILKQNTEPEPIVSHVPVSRPTSTHGSVHNSAVGLSASEPQEGTSESTLVKMPSITISDPAGRGVKSQDSNVRLQKSRSAEDYVSNDPHGNSRRGRPRSVSDVRHTRSNVRVFQLTYHGTRTLHKNQRLTQVMIPWVIAEIRRKSSESKRVILQISERGLLGICEEKGSVLFEHKLHNVFKFTPGYDSMFAYQWKPHDEPPDSKLFILEASHKEEVGRIHDTIKHATRNALQLDSGSHHSTHQVGLAALQELRDNNGTMFEVLYCGRVTVSHKSAPPSLIDDAIEKFKAHEREVQGRSLEGTRKRHFSSEDQLSQATPPSEYGRECPTSPKSHSMDELDKADTPFEAMRKLNSVTGGSIGSQGTDSTSGSVSSVLTNDSSEREWEIVPQERDWSGSWNSTSSGPSCPARHRIQRQDTFVKLVTSRGASHNRTMVFQIGKSALTLISTDKKSLTLTKKFTEISYCSQGIKNPEYFGFICRDTDSTTTATVFKCYVFKVQDEATVEIVMTTLRQAFAAALQQSKCNVMCEACPMNTYHRLCMEVKDVSPERALNIMRKSVEKLEEEQKTALAAYLRLHKPDDQQGQNELIMTFLRSHYEQKQALHPHDTEGKKMNGLNDSAHKPSPPPKIETNQAEGAFRKAKKSLASSFENLLSRNKSKDKTSPEPTRKRGTMVSFRSQPVIDPSTTVKADAETSPIEMAVAPLQMAVAPLGRPDWNSNHLQKQNTDPSLGHSVSTPQISVSPLTTTAVTLENEVPLRAPSPISPPTTLSLTSSHNSETFTPAKVHTRASSHREEMEVSPDGVPLTRRRSKTLGDSPSPLSPTSPPAMASATPLSPLVFTTPTSSKVTVNTRNSNLPRRQLKRAMSVDLTGSSPMPFTPSSADRRRTSFRQAIFKRVVTPMSEKKLSISDIAEEGDVFEDSPTQANNSYHMKDDANTGRFPHRAAVRALWKRAIREQILLNRMEKENSKLQDHHHTAVSESQQRMGYEELTPCIKEATQRWETILKEADKHYYLPEIIALLKQGIPRHRSGEVWKFLRNHMQRRSPASLQPCPEYGSYAELIKQLTRHQHAILIDLGRTYPHHPYFSNPLGRGQLSLFNLLKGYSLLDDEVGYCQGLSFVAGFLLMHMEEHDAFDMLVFIMYGLGCRRQYKPDMMALQIQMYQLSRLLHDQHRELHDHLEANEVGPSFYAAPWFLTFFTSQFPLGFVVRVFDMLFAQGWDAVFKVAVNILGTHSERLLKCENFEELIEYIKDEVPKMTYVELEKIITQSYNLDISKELQAYEVEYHVIQEELLHSPGISRTGSTEQEQLESVNQNLRRHNEELLEQLQTARNTINSQEKLICELQEKEINYREEVDTLSSERSTLVLTLNKLLDLIPQETLQESGIQVANLNMLMQGRTVRSSSTPTGVIYPFKENGRCQNGNR